MTHLNSIKDNLHQILRLIDLLEKEPSKSTLPPARRIKFVKEKLLKKIFENEKLFKRELR